MMALARWWHWLGGVRLTIRLSWPTRGDWCEENRGPVRW